jgi:hypothetical protein
MAVNLDNLFLPGSTVGVAASAAVAVASFGAFAAMPMVAFSGNDLDLLGVHLGRDWGGSLSGLGEANEAGVAVLVVASVVVVVVVEVVVVGIGVVDSFLFSFLVLGSEGANDGATIGSCGVAAAEVSFGAFAAMPIVALSGNDLDLFGVHLGRVWGGSLSGLGEANEAGVAVLVGTAVEEVVVVEVVVVGIGVVDSFSSSFLVLGSEGANDGATIGSCGVAAAAPPSFGAFAAMPMVALSGNDLDLLGVHLGRVWGGSLSGLGEAIEAGVAVLVGTAVEVVVVVVVVGGNGLVDAFSTSFVVLGSAGATFGSGRVDLDDDENDGTGSFNDNSAFCCGGGCGDVFSGTAVFSSTATS